MSTFGSFFVALAAVFIILGGPFTLFIVIKLLNQLFGDLKIKIIRNQSESNSEAPLALLVQWDDRSFDYAIHRVRVEFNEMIPGGRSTAFSFTFEDKKAQKKSFLIPMKLSKEDIQMLSDFGVSSNDKSLKRSFVVFEIEKADGETVRKKVPKTELLEGLMQASELSKDNTNFLSVTQPDSWSVFTRVFPWRNEVAAEASAGKEKKKAAGGSAVNKVFDFLITRVWIEPGCIVCDACENEAPNVFHVLSDTCIVRENAPLDNVGSIVAAAEGCPVDVIKYETKPKAS